MNLVERWFTALTTKKLQHSGDRSVKEFADDSEARAVAGNENLTRFVWHKSVEQILEGLACYGSAINHDVVKWHENRCSFDLARH